MNKTEQQQFKAMEHRYAALLKRYESLQDQLNLIRRMTEILIERFKLTDDQVDEIRRDALEI